MKLPDLKNYDVAVIGAGIVGLATALAASKLGKRVVVFERTPKAMGASVRNFGMLWPIGQVAGEPLDWAMRTREIWLDIAKKSDLWIRPSGSLHLAYHDDEMTVLEEFMSQTRGAGYQTELVTPEKTSELSSVVKMNGLKGALWSATEVNVSPRQAIDHLRYYLMEKQGVDFMFNKTIMQIDFPYLYTSEEEFEVFDQIYVCSGSDFETLYPSVFSASGMTKCKLQMLSTVAQSPNFDMGAMLCAGLTLRHYEAFAACPTLEALSARFDREQPLFKEFGIHVLLSQNHENQLVIGDSHEYGMLLSPFDKERINELILGYLNSFAALPNANIEERWHGIYPKLKGKTFFHEEVEPNVSVINGLGGAGMTLSFGVTEAILKTVYA
ncbi:MAG: TIGR03364 family FAD-dependent oxidoreductase [Saprospiraceae bacterium]|nr:TIGR03364 family FAD-dependent oxidoreductase [Saprospiraceae bacterium]